MIFFFNADDEDDTVIVNSEEWEVRKSDEVCDTLKIEATNEYVICINNRPLHFISKPTYKKIMYKLRGQYGDVNKMYITKNGERVTFD
jgi:hypothetical protein